MTPEKQKTDVELLSEVTGLEVATIISVNPRIYSKNALDALSLKSNQLQATVDELKQRCEELEMYAEHKEDCALNEDVCVLCNNFETDHNSPDGSCPPEIEQITLRCSCKLDQLLTLNERK